CIVVTDEQPGFFLPHMVAAAGEQLDVKLEQVDGNGLLPLRAVDRWFSTAASFRRELQKKLAPHLARFPVAKLPRARLAKATLPSLASWPSASELAKLPIDHSVAPVG